MNNCDLILHFVDKYILEKEKSIMLQQQLAQYKQITDDKKVKTDKQ